MTFFLTQACFVTWICNRVRQSAMERRVTKWPWNFIKMYYMNMMKSSNGNIFRVTGPLCGEFTGHRWIPRTKTSDAELWCFLLSAPEETWANNRDASNLRRHRAHYDVYVMKCFPHHCQRLRPSINKAGFPWFICYWLEYCWINNRVATDTRRHEAHLTSP